MRFTYTNIHFKKHEQENWLLITGEITNDSGKNFSSVVFRIVVFIGNVPVGTAMLKIKNFPVGKTKTFEARLGELSFQIVPQISRYDIYAESAY
ncbi:MAG: hypothetical protein C4533_07455 [Candidatus Omnitrophota bacterium]|jgi:hypothetical protein|nr:MAG: hypothetical protein C4533_07455 [Candidatus Omnitrophota bacterium]